MSSSRQFSPAGAGPDAGTGGSLLDTVPEVHVLDRLAVVFKHMRLIGAVFAIVVSLAMLESVLGNAALPIAGAHRHPGRADDGDRDVELERPGVLAGSGAVFHTQYRILQSRGLARRGDPA